MEYVHDEQKVAIARLREARSKLAESSSIGWVREDSRSKVRYSRGDPVHNFVLDPGHRIW